MNKQLIVALFISFVSAHLNIIAAEPIVDQQSISITILSPRADSLSGDLGYRDIDFWDLQQPIILKGKLIKGGVQFILQKSTPVLVDLKKIFNQKGANVFQLVLLEPGDHINIIKEEDQLTFSGKGSEKLGLLKAFYSKQSSLNSTPSNRVGEIRNISDFWLWNAYIDGQEKIVSELVRNWKSKIHAFALNYIRSQLLSKMELDRISCFAMVDELKGKFGVTGKELEAIYKKVFSGQETKWFFSYSGPTVHDYVYYEYARQTTLRKYGFDLKNDNVVGVNRTISYFNTARQLYRGNVLINCLTYLVTTKGIKEHTYKYGYVPEFEKLLQEYYKISSGYPKHTQFVKEYDGRYHRYLLGIRQKGYDFQLSDIKGHFIKRSTYDGKLLLINFWDPNNVESSKTAQILLQVIKKIGDHTDLVFINVSAEQNRNEWLEQIKAHKLEDANNLFTDGRGFLHPVFRAYGANNFPSAVLLDGNGRSMFNSNSADFLLMHSGPVFPDPLKDDGEGLIAAIEGHISQLSDGPYVFEEKGIKATYHFQDNEFSKTQTSVLQVQTDQSGKYFDTSLKNSITIQNSESVRPEILFALSDIEGNFDKFRLLLQNNGVIDTAYNWTFGKGHLVFSGDMFDRGKQVTECLWLVYSLEEKAKAAGGQVHFILGNHEIMNLQGDHRYVDEKYKQTAQKLGKTLTELYGEKSELGRWLRTKNIVEKIGDLLFVHGGLSPQINASLMTVSDINKLARPYYAYKRPDYGDANTDLVMNEKFGPFWYRGYYDKNKDATKAVDSILLKYKVKHIVTGHTIVADSISTWFDNKVINTDVPHAQGMSEALLIEGKNFYRVTYKGEKFLLFKDPE